MTSPSQTLFKYLGIFKSHGLVILVANDTTKAEPIACLLRNESTLDVPASVLETHPDCDIYLTKDVYLAAKAINGEAK